MDTAPGLSMGFISLEQHGGSFGYRHQSLRTLFTWGRQMGLEVFPGSPIVYKHFAAFRLLVHGVNSATIENDFIAISAMHVAFRERISLNIHNPVKNAEVKSLIKHLTTAVRVKAQATRSFALRDFVKLVDSLDRTDPRQLHTRVLLQCVGLGALRRGAAKKMRLIRLGKPLYSTRMHPTLSDAHILPHAKYRYVLVLRKEVDKCLPAGREHFSYIPDRTAMGLTPVSDLILWLTTYPVPDGPLFACPTGSTATAFRTTEYGAIDLALSRAWARCFPDRVSEKIAPHSLRKMMIQALYDHLKLQGVIPDGPVGEFVGWHNIKKDTRAHYAQLSMEEALALTANIDPVALPAVIATVAVPPVFYDSPPLN